MSVLETKHDQDVVEFVLDPAVPTERKTPERASAAVDAVRPAQNYFGRVARLLATARERRSSKNARAQFFEPAVYQEYRTRLARREVANEGSLHD
jgi:hypothetical protein